MNLRQFSERMRRVIELGGGTFIAVWVAVGFWYGVFTVPEHHLYDWRFALRGERPPLEDILIIPIDESSKQHLQQRYPWKRSLHARLIHTLTQYKPKLILYDMIFQSKTDEKEDQALADALYDAYDEERDMQLVVLAQYIASEIVQRPLPLFTDYAAATGGINLHQDQDSIVRSLPILSRTVEGETYQDFPCFGLQAALLYKGGADTIDFPSEELTVFSRTRKDQSREEVLRVVAPRGRLWINYIGGRYAYPMIPFWKILEGRFQPEEIEDKVIFIGDTSLTSHDYFLTPFQKPAQTFVKALEEETLQGGELSNTPTFGVEIHAQAFQSILEQTFLRKVPPLWSVVSILVIISLSGLILFKDRGFLGNTGLLLCFSVAIWGSSQYLFVFRNLWVDIAPLLLGLFLNYVGGLGFQRAVALYNKNKIKGAFQQYVSTAVVEEMLQHPEKLHLGGERKFLTVLFSDIRGFTSISEQMESQALVEFLNEYLTDMTEVILQYNGTLDKYMGDAIMAIYGAPVEQDDHAVRACASALDMMLRLRQLYPQWVQQGKPPIHIGIGINSGSMTVGNMGSEKRFDFTVMGDHVNLASRLEGTNKQYGTGIIISEYTYETVKSLFVVRELDLVRVKGKKEPVRIYELLGRSGHVDQVLLEGIAAFEAGLTAYRSRQWKLALEQFSQTLRLVPDDGPSKLYFTRCQAYQHTPPPENWDGVYTMTTK